MTQPRRKTPGPRTFTLFAAGVLLSGLALQATGNMGNPLQSIRDVQTVYGEPELSVAGADPAGIPGVSLDSLSASGSLSSGVSLNSLSASGNLNSGVSLGSLSASGSLSSGVSLDSLSASGSLNSGVSLGSVGASGSVNNGASLGSLSDDGEDEADDEPIAFEADAGAALADDEAPAASSSLQPIVFDTGDPLNSAADAGADGLSWDAFGGVLFNLWFLCAVTVVVIIAQQAVRASLRFVRSRSLKPAVQ